MTDATEAAGLRGLAHEIWALAQRAPNEGIEDCTARIETALRTALAAQTGESKASVPADTCLYRIDTADGRVLVADNRDGTKRTFYPVILVAASPSEAKEECTSLYGGVTITGPAEDVAFVVGHLPDVDAPAEAKGEPKPHDPPIEYRYEGGTHWCPLGPAERMKPDFKGVYRIAAGKYPVEVNPQQQVRKALTLDYIDQHIGIDEGDREAVIALVREVEAAHGIKGE